MITFIAGLKIFQREKAHWKMTVEQKAIKGSFALYFTFASSKAREMTVGYFQNQSTPGNYLAKYSGDSIYDSLYCRLSANIGNSLIENAINALGNQLSDLWKTSRSKLRRFGVVDSERGLCMS